MLENGGSALSTAITAASIALVDAGIEMYDVVVGATVLFCPHDEQQTDLKKKGSTALGKCLSFFFLFYFLIFVSFLLFPPLEASFLSSTTNMFLLVPFSSSFLLLPFIFFLFLLFSMRPRISLRGWTRPSVRICACPPFH